VSRLKEGAFFGEIALLTNFTRTTTVEATAETTVIEISREVVSDMIEEHPGVLKVLLRFFRYRLIDTLIETSELFAPFSSEEREKLACHFTFLEADPGTHFIQEGKPSDGLYILLSGQLEVSQGDRAGQLPPLDLGDLFGAASLLGGGKSPFSVRAKSKTWLLKLERETFRKVIMTHPQVLAFVSDLVERRFKEQADTPALAKSSDTRLPLI
jgi:CRP-like cAMP-binding protein